MLQQVLDVHSCFSYEQRVGISSEWLRFGIGLKRNMQPFTPEADAYAHPQHPSKTETYLKVTSLTVAPSGWFLHLPVSSDMDGRLILTCIMGDLAGIN